VPAVSHPGLLVAVLLFLAAMHRCARFRSR
jgi:hypothetical protein